MMRALIQIYCPNPTTQKKKDLDFWTADEETDQKFEQLLRDYHWYGVDGFFPFTTHTDSGLNCGEAIWDNERKAFLYDKAYTLAEKYYSLATVYESPDSTPYEIYESNYPQFNSSKLSNYRWYWAEKWRTEDGFSPAQPKSYELPIVIKAAVMNWNFLDLQYGTDLPLSTLTEMQGKWMTQNYPDKPAEQERFYQLTGLCILNGDSRTEETYFHGSRAKDIRITVNHDVSVEVELRDTPAPQLIDLAFTQTGIMTPMEIQIECLTSYTGENTKVYITEIGVGLNSNLVQGR